MSGPTDTPETSPSADATPIPPAVRHPGLNGHTQNSRREHFRWDTAVGFRGAAFLEFGQNYFGTADRRVLIVAGAGFDPRAPRLAEHLALWAPDRVTAVLLREERPIVDPLLKTLAEDHVQRFRRAIPSLTEVSVSIFDTTDSAVVGGRKAAYLVRSLPLDEVTDIIVDLSALSVGTSFPLVRTLLDEASVRSFNLHATVVADAALDATIVPQPAEAATAIHGFRGELGLDRRADAARLWLPQLAFGRRELLDRVHAGVEPHDTCPILPFPADDPRVGDRLLNEYLPFLTGTWDVDPRNMIYAAEDDPLDVYRTILELDDARAPVFEGDGGSLCVLTPAGSKVLGLGALLAAIERDFPIWHVEAVGFTVDAAALRDYTEERGTFAHVWLEGEPYASRAIACPCTPAPLSPP